MELYVGLDVSIIFRTLVLGLVGGLQLMAISTPPRPHESTAAFLQQADLRAQTSAFHLIASAYPLAADPPLEGRPLLLLATSGIGEVLTFRTSQACRLALAGAARSKDYSFMPGTEWWGGHYTAAT